MMMMMMICLELILQAFNLFLKVVYHHNLALVITGGVLVLSNGIVGIVGIILGTTTTVRSRPTFAEISLVGISIGKCSTPIFLLLLLPFSV